MNSNVTLNAFKTERARNREKGEGVMRNIIFRGGKKKDFLRV
jgi:hypothetical protein